MSLKEIVDAFIESGRVLVRFYNLFKEAEEKSLQWSKVGSTIYFYDPNKGTYDFEFQERFKKESKSGPDFEVLTLLGPFSVNYAILRHPILHYKITKIASKTKREE